jgi:hypothetical protein
MASTIHTVLRQRWSAFNSNFLSPIRARVLGVVRNQRLQPYLVIAFTLWLVGVVEIVQKIAGQHLDPRFWMLVAVAVTVYSGIRIFRLTPKSIKTFRKWSPAVDEMVARMQNNGLTVYPVPVAEKGNDGVVVVARSGVYALELKSQKVFGSRRIEYGRENELILGGRISDRRPVQQAQGMAETVRETLAETALTAESTVTPLVVFLDDWTINDSGITHEVPVVTAGELQPFLDAQANVLNDAEVAEISACLAAAC